jgi:hypothetical protein
LTTTFDNAAIPTSSHWQPWLYRFAAWALLLNAVWVANRWCHAKYDRWQAAYSAYIERFDAEYGPEVARLRKLSVGAPLQQLESELHAQARKIEPPDTILHEGEDLYHFAEPPIRVVVANGNVCYMWPDFPEPIEYARVLRALSWFWGASWALCFVKILLSAKYRMVSAEALGAAMFIWLASKALLDANFMETVSYANNHLTSLAVLVGLAISISATVWSWTFPAGAGLDSDSPLLTSALDVRPGIHPYLFEHHPEKNLRSMLATAIAGIHPSRFWRQLRPWHVVVPERLALYAGVCIAPAIAAGVLCGLLEPNVYPDSGALVWIRRGLDILGLRTGWIVLTDLVARSRMTNLVATWAIAVVLLPLLVLIALNCFRGMTGSRFSGNWQIARAAIHVCDITLPCSVGVLIAVLLCLMGRQFYESASVSVLVSFLIAIPTILWRLVAVWRFHFSTISPAQMPGTNAGEL